MFTRFFRGLLSPYFQGSTWVPIPNTIVDGDLLLLFYPTSFLVSCLCLSWFVYFHGKSTGYRGICLCFFWGGSVLKAQIPSNGHQITRHDISLGAGRWSKPSAKNKAPCYWLHRIISYDWLQCTSHVHELHPPRKSTYDCVFWNPKSAESPIFCWLPPCLMLLSPLWMVYMPHL